MHQSESEFEESHRLKQQMEENVHRSEAQLEENNRLKQELERKIHQSVFQLQENDRLKQQMEQKIHQSGDVYNVKNLRQMVIKHVDKLRNLSRGLGDLDAQLNGKVVELERGINDLRVEFSVNYGPIVPGTP